MDDGQARARFLDHLAATCNVVQSAKAVGMSSTTAHGLRRRDSDFATQWGAALEAGYQHLEAKLLARALGQDGGADTGAVPPGGDPSAVDTGPFDPQAALELLRQHYAALAAGAGTRRRTPFAFKEAPIEQVQASLLAKLEARAKRLRGAKP